jgi:hypothetical protein
MSLKYYHFALPGSFPEASSWLNLASQHPKECSFAPLLLSAECNYEHHMKE